MRWRISKRRRQNESCSCTVCKAGHVQPRVWATHPLAAWRGRTMRAHIEADPRALTKCHSIPVKRLIFTCSVCYLYVRDVCLWCQFFWESIGGETLELHILGWCEFLSAHAWGWTGTGRGCAASKDPRPWKDWGCHQPRVPGKPSQCHHHINGSDNWLLIRAHLGLDVMQEVIDLVMFHSHNYLLKW